MNEKLLECLGLINAMMADVDGEYPIGLIRVRRLLLEMIEDEAARLLARHAYGSVDDESADGMTEGEYPKPAA